MPVLTHLGPAAPCGPDALQVERLRPGYQDNLFVAQFNMQRSRGTC